MEKKIATILGARPQFIKAAVISRIIKELNDENSSQLIDEIIIHSGQHYDIGMSQIFFDELDIPKPHYFLDVNGSSHAVMTGMMLIKIEKCLNEIKPDIVLIYGDTNTTLAGALTAAKLNIPVAHVEAGLRSFNRNMPEEINRILADKISSILFCPTTTAVNNLNNEGIGIEDKKSLYGQKVVLSGDVMYDSVLYYEKIAKPSDQIKKIIEEIKDNFYLATIHRAENTNDLSRLRNIIEALEEISKQTPVIIPLHPRTKKIINDNRILTKHIKFIEPAGYFDLLTLLSKCKGVFTDSGGLQKEAYFMKKFCVILRDETEWVELVRNNAAVLVGADKEQVVTAEKKLSSLNVEPETGLFGDGKAGEKIVGKLISEN